MRIQERVKMIQDETTIEFDYIDDVKQYFRPYPLGASKKVKVFPSRELPSVMTDVTVMKRITCDAIQ